jgi:hypothetical protein
MHAAPFNLQEIMMDINDEEGDRFGGVQTLPG